MKPLLQGLWGLGLLAATLLPLLALAGSLLAGVRRLGYKPRLAAMHAAFYGALLPSALFAPYPSPIDLPFLPASRERPINLIANSESAASWSSPSARLLGRVPAPAGATNAYADCLELAPAPHSYLTPAAEVALPPGGYELTGSLFVRSFSSASDGQVVHLQAGGFMAHEPPTPHVLGPDWQRLSHRNQVELKGDQVLLLLLVNHDPARATSVCVSAAQLELGAEATSYQSPLARVEAARRSGLDRVLASLAVFGVAGLSYLSASGWGTLWTAARRSGLLQALAPLALVLGLWALEQRLGIFSPGAARAAGLSHHPNVFGGALAVFGLLALSAARRWPFALMAIAGTALGVLATGSRGALVAFLVGLALWGGLRALRAPRLALTGVTALALLLALALELSGRLEVGTAGQSRAEIYAAALTLSLERPLTGWGLGSASDQLLRALWESSPQTYAHAHNLVLQFGLEGGLLALLGLATASALLAGARGARPFAPALAALFVGNLFDYTLGTPELYVLALALVGAVLAAPPQTPQTAVEAPRAPAG